MGPKRRRWIAAGAIAGAVACTVPNPKLHRGGTGTDGGSSSTGATGTAAGTSTTTTSGTSSSAGSQTGGSTSAVCADTCVAVPATWNGPVGRLTSPAADPSPTCPAAFAADPTTVYTGELQQVDAMCTCSCDPPPDAACATTTVYYYASSSACNAFQDSFAVGACNNSVSGIMNSYWAAVLPAISSGSCQPHTTKVLPEVTFDTRLALCGALDGGGCPSGSRCVPQPADPLQPGLCIWRSGDVECPASWGTKTLAHHGTNDKRDCQTCTCGDAKGSCSAEIRLYHDSPTCSATPIATFDADGACYQGQTFYATTQASLSVLGIQPGAACDPSDPMPTGEVTATGPVTVCCR